MTLHEKDVKGEWIPDSGVHPRRQSHPGVAWEWQGRLQEESQPGPPEEKEDEEETAGGTEEAQHSQTERRDRRNSRPAAQR